MKRLLLVLLIGSIVMAGCINGDNGNDEDVTVKPNSGLSITFEALQNEYEVDGGSESAGFGATVENTGEYDATGVSLSLFGASWVQGESASLGDLQAASPDQGIVGGSDQITFSPEINVELGSGQQDDYDVGLRTQYEYGTIARGKFTMLSPDEYNRDTTRSTMETNSHAAPVSVSFRGEKPYPSDWGWTDIPILIENRGSGTVIDGAVELDVGIAEESDDSSMLRNCNGAVELSDGTREITCQINTEAWDVDPELTVTMQVNATYEYQEDADTQVTVISE